MLIYHYHLGRILRAKRRNDEGFNAYFYSLVSKDTQEMYYSTKRQQFLIDQGYEFKVITELKGMMADAQGLVFSTKREQQELLFTVLQASENELGNQEEGDVRDADDIHRYKVKRSLTSVKSLSGGDAMAYLEYGGASGSASSRQRSKAPANSKLSRLMK
jgi:DNA excision repair protein ERCC-3